MKQNQIQFKGEIKKLHIHTWRPQEYSLGIYKTSRQKISKGVNQFYDSNYMDF